MVRRSVDVEKRFHFFKFLIFLKSVCCVVCRCVFAAVLCAGHRTKTSPLLEIRADFNFLRCMDGHNFSDQLTIRDPRPFVLRDFATIS